MVRAELTATTDSLPGWEIVEHLGVVTAEVVSAADFFRDFAVEVRDLVGGRSGTLEGVLRRARAECLEELRNAAHRARGHALVGVRLSIDAPTKSVLIVSAIGSVVRVARSGSGEIPSLGSPDAEPASEDDAEEPPPLEAEDEVGDDHDSSAPPSATD